MSTPLHSSEATPGAQIPLPARSLTVISGRLDFFSVLLRSISGELYKIRRRSMSKVLLAIGILIIIAGFAVNVLPAVFVYYSPPASFLPPSCALLSQLGQPGGTAPRGSCLDHAPTQADLAQAAQTKQKALQSAAAPLHLPGSFATAIGITNFIGLLLLLILAGTIVGGEYSVGTIRLLLTRGPTRTQFLLGKIGTLLICCGLTFLVLVPIGIVMGAILLPLVPGIAVDFGFFTGMWVLHAFLYLLIAIMGLFIYSMIALCLATLGRATAAGVAGAIVWWVLESILGSVLAIFGAMNKGPLGDFLKAIPDYFIGNNITALLTNQSQYLLGDQPSPLSNLHALLVLAAYLAIFIGVAWSINEYRDVTN